MSNDNYLSPLCSCVICKKVKSAKGIHSHYHLSHTEAGKERNYIAGNNGGDASKTLHTSKNAERETEYNKTPNACTGCASPLPFIKRNNKYCSHNCKAKHTNAARKSNGYTVTKETKTKIANTLTKYCKIFYCKKCNSLHSTKINAKECCKTKYTDVVDFSKIYICKCKSCSISFANRRKLQYCNKCREFSSNKRSEYAFNFNIFEYPELFDLEQLTTVGFYGPNGKSGRWNPNGLSRDHRISIDCAIKNKYNTYYITHPLNCDLIPHTENNKKKTKSSITYDELVLQVAEYDSMVGVVGF